MGLTRKSTITMHSKVIFKITDAAINKYEELGIKNYHHLIICNEHVYAYIWDTRKIEQIVNVQCIDQNDVTYNVLDNRMDLLCIKEEVSNEIWQIAQSDAEFMPILFAEGELTDHEKELLTIEHI